MATFGTEADGIFRPEALLHSCQCPSCPPCPPLSPSIVPMAHCGFDPEVSPLLQCQRGRNIMPLGRSGAQLMALLALGRANPVPGSFPLPVREDRGLVMLEKQK